MCLTLNRAGQPLKVWALALLLAIGAVEPTFAQSFKLPAVVDPPSQERHVGKVIFLELVTPDMAVSKNFYSQLLGWNFRDIQVGPTAYAEAWLDGRPVAGLLQRPLPSGRRRQPAWLSFFSVPDLDAAEAIAKQHGAKLLFGPRTFADRGREAVFSDPQGAVFALLTSSSGDPPDFLADPGEWIWSSLHTTDPNSALAFYQELFGYQVFPLASSEAAHHFILASRNYARASVNSLPVGDAGSPPYWLNYVRVNDATKTAERVVQLGGRILVEPRLDRQGGKLAVVADPQGTVFGLLEWPEGETKEFPK